jgi:hypothetical protein
MNTTTVNTEGIDRLIARVRSLESIDFMPLMEEWRGILEKDNEDNLGIDGYGVPLAEVTYRPDPNVGSRAARYGLEGINREIIPPYNNLHSSHYRSLDGPPLSPRGADSRITRNFATKGEGPMADGSWHVLGSWVDFLSVDGFEILTAHADGPDHNPKLPIRDVLHVRPGALQRARDALILFVKGILGRQGD